MPGLGTIINVVAIVAGGLLGLLVGRSFDTRKQESLTVACGVSTLFIGISGALEGMLSLEGTALSGGHTMLVVLCLVIGTAIGELLGIEEAFESFGEWLKQRTGNARDASFVNAFVTASLTVCIGAMAIVGAIQDGILGDWSTLAVKSVLDFIIVAVMTSTLGKGSIFSAIPVGVFEGSVTLLARVLQPLMTDAAMANVSLVGSILIFCVGVNLVWGKRVRVANMLPALIIAIAAAFIPFSM